jgi:hypothetical protein
MIFAPDRANAAYFGAFLAYTFTGPEDSATSDAVEAAAVDAYLEAYAAAAALEPQPMLFEVWAEVRTTGYNAAREAAQAAYTAAAPRLQLAA